MGSETTDLFNPDLDQSVDDFFAHFGLDTSPEPIDEADDFLSHYGIRGMKWGIRRNRAQIDAGSSEDAAKANEIRAKVAKGGVSSLSNQEMQHLVQRMNLEQQYSRMTYQPSKIAKGKAQVDTMLQTANTINSVIKFTRSPAGQLLMDKAFPNANPPQHRKEPKKKGKKS